MRDTRNSGNTNPSKSGLLAFKPRQVLLAEHYRKTTMTATSNNKAAASPKTLTTEHKALLLHAVVRYLERNGFSKTLKRFLSEAQIENVNWKAASFDLEDLYCEYMDRCNHSDTNFNTCKEQELRIDGTTKKNEISSCAVSNGLIKKKKKKSGDESEGIAAADQYDATDKKLTESAKNAEAILANDMVTNSKVKSKEKKKNKKTSDSLGQTDQVKSDVLKWPVDDSDTVHELQTDESTKKHKDKKKKKTMVISESSAGDVQEEPGATEEKSQGLASSVCDSKTDYEEEVKTKEKKKKNKRSTESALGNTLDTLEEKNVESKDKGKKEGSVLERLSGGAEEVIDHENQLFDSKNECFQSTEDAIKKEKKSSKKRKRLSSDESEYQLVEKDAFEVSKRRKAEGLEEANNKDQLTKGDGGKESKQENGQVGDNERHKTSVKQLDGHANENLEKNGREKTSINQFNEHASGNLEKNGLDKSATRKQRNGSAEPKTVNAFQRVKIDEVIFADKKLEDNSYWAKDGAEVGYGAKAQEILGQVKGRDFRHEKTKKKRGSYRGGQIDLHSHSIKFNYSEED